MFGIGDKFSNVLQLPGVETEWSGYDNSGTWYWKWEGLWFAPSQETISENLSRRLYQPIQAPTPADFGRQRYCGLHRHRIAVLIRREQRSILLKSKEAGRI